jgi:hypothetical protein
VVAERAAHVGVHAVEAGVLLFELADAGEGRGEGEM